MIIYNVTIKTAVEITEEWLNWMKEEHLKEMMETGLFLEYRISKLLEQDEEGHSTFVVQYLCENEESYQKYIDEHATSMREKGYLKFGNQFVGFRTIMEVLNFK